jgi:hypothetical protein
VSWAALAHSFYWRHAHQRDQSHDTVVYAGYGFAMRGGELPYRDFGVVYPPGALPVFVAPALVVPIGDRAGYDVWLGRLMALCGVACVLLVVTLRPPIWSLAFVALSPLFVGSLLLDRFDLWPTALLAAALAAFIRGRHTLGFATLGLAVAAKLFAIVAVPLAAIWVLQRAGRRALRRGLVAWGAVLIAVFAPFALLAPRGLWTSLREQAVRPIQIESLVGSALMTFSRPHTSVSLGSVSLAGHEILAITSTALQLAVLIALWCTFARGKMESGRLVRYFAACVCAFIVFGKVLSPQFLIWLVPLVPAVGGRRGLAASLVFAGALILTQWYFPEHYPAVIAGRLAWLVFLRDLGLMTVLALLSAPGRSTRRVRLAPGHLP